MKKISLLPLLLLLTAACGSSKDETDRTLTAPSDLSIEYVDDWSGVLHWKDNAANEKGYYVFIVEEGESAAGPLS